MNVLDKLKEGDLRTTGRSNEVVNDVLKKQELFKEVFSGLYNTDPGVKMRSADAIEKITLEKPELLSHFKKELLTLLSSTQQEVRWHLAQIYPRLTLSKSERDKIINTLLEWINTEKSNIVKVFSLQALADFTKQDESLKPRVIKIINEAMKSGIKSVISRGKKLLKEL